MDDGNSLLSEWRRKCGKETHAIPAQQPGGEYETPSISKVPNVLQRGQNNDIFTPQVISLGPHHFLTPHLAQMETEKSMIIQRTIAIKLPPHFFKSLEIIQQTGELPDLISHDDFFKRVLTKCKTAYGDHTKFNLKLHDFSLMMFRDTCFLLVFLSVFVRDKERDHNSSAAPFHGLSSGEGHYLDMIKDVVKLENQIPLCALEALYAFVAKPNEGFEDFVANICSYYSPFWIQSTNFPPLVGKATHLLHCIHEISVNGPSSCNFEPKKFRKGYHPKSNCLSGSTVLPSAVNLFKAGVKLRAFEGGIKHIRFDGEQCTLYLPVLKFGILTETIMRNLIAFELCSPAFKEKAVTSFARLLDELIEGEKDVELLRRTGILVNWDGRDEKVADILKRLRRSTWKPYFEPISDAKNSLCEVYSKRKLRILWSEFLEAYCSKPWVLISAVAATLLLLMTAVQVFCLFYTCNR